MKILVYSTYFLTPPLERELEIALNHRERGDEVKILRCRGQLPTCLLNFEHRRSVCTYCVGKFDRGLDIAGIPPEDQLELPPPPEGVWPGIPDFETREELEAYRYDGADVGKAVASTLVWFMNKDPEFDVVEERRAIRVGLTTAIFVYRSMLGVLEAEKPDLVYTFNGRHLTTRPALRACEARGVDFVTHERAGSFQRYMLRRNRLPHDAKAIAEEVQAVWERGGPRREEVGEGWFRARRQGGGGAWFAFTSGQKRGTLPESFDPEKELLAIFNSTMEEQIGMPRGRNPIYDDELEGIPRLVEDLADDDLQIYIRIHPNLSDRFRRITPENNSQLRRLVDLEKRFENVEVLPPDSPVDTYALIDAARAVVVFGSTVGVEATFWGRVSILAGTWAVYQGLDCCYKPQTHEEVLELVREETSPMPRTEAVKYGYWQENFGVPYRRFEHTGVLQGRWEGRRIVPRLSVRLLAYFRRLAEVRGWQGLTELAKDFRKLWSRS